MLLFKNLTINQQNTIDYNFKAGADWHLTGFIYFDSKTGRVAFYKIEQSEMDH